MLLQWKRNTSKAASTEIPDFEVRCEMCKASSKWSVNFKCFKWNTTYHCLPAANIGGLWSDLFEYHQIVPHPVNRATVGIVRRIGLQGARYECPSTLDFEVCKLKIASFFRLFMVQLLFFESININLGHPILRNCYTTKLATDLPTRLRVDIFFFRFLHVHFQVLLCMYSVGSYNISWIAFHGYPTSGL